MSRTILAERMRSTGLLLSNVNLMSPAPTLRMPTVPVSSAIGDTRGITRAAQILADPATALDTSVVIGAATDATFTDVDRREIGAIGIEVGVHRHCFGEASPGYLFSSLPASRGMRRPLVHRKLTGLGRELQQQGGFADRLAMGIIERSPGGACVEAEFSRRHHAAASTAGAEACSRYSSPIGTSGFRFLNGLPL